MNAHAQPGASVRRRARASWSTAAAFLLGLGLTWGGLRLLEGTRKAEAKADEDRRAARVLDDLRFSLDRYGDLLFGARSFLESRPSVDAAEWGTYTAALDLPVRHPGVKSLAFIVPVRREEVPAYLAAQAKAGNPFEFHGEYHPRPGDPEAAPPSPDCLLIQFVAPLPANQGGLGLDVGANPMQRPAAEAAKREGLPQLTGALVFGDLGPDQAALGYFLPVQGKSGFQGWVSLGIWVKPLLAHALAAGGGTEVEVLDLGPGGMAPAPRPLFQAGAALPAGVAAHRLEVGGRVWEVRLPASASGLPLEERLLWCAAGLLLSLAMAALVGSQARTRDRAEALAATRTRDLAQALYRHRAFLAQTPQGVIDWDAQARIIGWNPGAEAIFGYGEEEVLGRSWEFLAAEHQREESRARWLGPDGEPRLLQGTGRSMTKEGRAITCEWRHTVLRDPATGKADGYISLVENVTARLQEEEARRQGQKLESLGLLAGGVAHDFNNLLTAIGGYAEMAAEDTPKEHPAQESLGRIQRAVERAALLARQMLDYAGRGRPARRLVDFNRLVGDLGDLLRVSVSKKVHLDLQLAPDLPPLEADPAQAQQVLMNLVTNASEAIGDQEGRIILRTRACHLDEARLAEDFPGQSLQPGDFLALEVEDTGCGMDGETLARIFDPFFTTKFTGRGLGLSGVLGIIRSHRGGLRVQSEPGRGTRFEVLLPMAAPAGRPRSAEMPAMPDADLPALRGRVLVVDDEAEVRNLVARTLRKAGAEVVEASDGAEALARLQEASDPFGLVVTDLTMPGLGGLELAKAMEDMGCPSKILLMSGYSETSPGRAGNDPAHAFLAKPFTINALLRKVAKILGA